ncbi:hypothetical protein KAI04_02805 [Candidatus Pacearchaeota archaeon]|nr:hypothetical protein [Candidatus Pacearchaeota archaeon]
MIKQKKAAMEMSVGTIVTIVLLMSVLILGIFLVQKIFLTSTNAIDGVDTKIQSEIDNLFSTNQDAKYSTIPKEREVVIKKGDSGGFAFSVFNKDTIDANFAYVVTVSEVASNCQLTEEEADKLINLGRQGDQNIPSGDKMEDAFFVKFQISDTTPLCEITYKVEITKDDATYTGFSKVLVIK